MLSSLRHSVQRVSADIKAGVGRISSDIERSRERISEEMERSRERLAESLERKGLEIGKNMMDDGELSPDSEKDRLEAMYLDRSRPTDVKEVWFAGAHCGAYIFAFRVYF